jgi:hypothetical protein
MKNKNTPHGCALLDSIKLCGLDAKILTMMLHLTKIVHY